jgi:hypothetical protein
MAEYFDMVGPVGDRRRRFRVTHTHLIGKTITYRPARWYERLWLWLTSVKVETRKLRYDRPTERQRQ